MNGSRTAGHRGHRRVVLLALATCCAAGVLASGSRAPAVRDARAEPRKAATPAAAKARTEPKSGLEIVPVPGGSFRLGCEPQDEHCFADEKPGKSVEVKAFAIGKTPTTVRAYRKCVDAGACSAPREAGNCTWKAPDRDDHPINCVTFEQATAFCGWIGGRLPTAEEWEYAAKGGESRVYPWGDERPASKHANFCDASCGRAHRDWTWVDSSQDDGWPATSPVGVFPAGASRHGLLDMVGNTAQWTSTDAPQGTKEVRGGGWDLYPRYLRASAKVGLLPDRPYENVSVRCVL